jgi:hypothetical protein
MDIQSCKLLRDSLFVKKGINSGCPFCRALNYTESPKLGDNIKILTEYMPGLIGEVIGDENALPIRDSSIPPDEFSTNRIVYLRPGEILVHVNGSEYYTHIDIKDHLLEPEPFLPIPDWAFPISFYWAANFHSFIMRVCNDSFYDSKWKFNRFALIIPITYIFKRRLPIDSIDFWAILEAHGFPLKWKKRLATLYEDCQEVVRIYHFMNSGKNYKRKNRVTPLSIE